MLSWLSTKSTATLVVAVAEAPRPIVASMKADVRRAQTGLLHHGRLHWSTGIATLAQAKFISVLCIDSPC